MLVKIHKSYRDIVAICDSGLIGKRFEQDKFQLDVKKDFFNGEEKSEKEVIKIMQSLCREDATFNIVGEKSVRTAVNAGIITPDCVKKIKGIPYTMVFL